MGGVTMTQLRFADVKADVAALRQALGDEHPDTFKARIALALTYRESDRDDDAVEMLEDVVAICERVLGRDHLDISERSTRACH